MGKKGQIDLEEIFKSIIVIIFFIVVIGALTPLIGDSGFLNLVLSLSSWLIGCTVVMVVLAFVIKILNELEI